MDKSLIFAGIPGLNIAIRTHTRPGCVKVWWTLAKWSVTWCGQPERVNLCLKYRKKCIIALLRGTKGATSIRDYFQIAHTENWALPAVHVLSDDGAPVTPKMYHHMICKTPNVIVILYKLTASREPAWKNMHVYQKRLIATYVIQMGDILYHLHISSRLVDSC